MDGQTRVEFDRRGSFDQRSPDVLNGFLTGTPKEIERLLKGL